MLVDLLIQLPIVFAMMYLMFGFGLSAFTGFLVDPTMFNPVIVLWYFGISSGIVLFYHMLFESSAWRASPGKLMVGIMVTDMAGAQIGLTRAAIRAWPVWLGGFVYAFVYFNEYAAVGHLVSLISFGACVLVAFTQKKQGLHDIIAGTLIIRRRAIFENSSTYR